MAMNRMVCCVALVYLLACSATQAEPPVVAFDVAMVIACREVNPRKTASKPDSHRLVEAVFKISSSVEAGTEADLKELAYTLSDGKDEKTIVVEDFLPKTEVYTDIVEPIVMIDVSDSSVSGSCSANYRTLASAATSDGEAGAQAKTAARSSVQYKKLAPKSVLLTSGTKDRRHAVFYKLRPSTQDSLEGERAFSVILEVPEKWSGDWVRVHCHAQGVKRGTVNALDKDVVSGMASFSVGLYLEGDDKARRLAEDLAAEQQRLFDELAKVREDDGSWPVQAWQWLWFVAKLRPGCGAAASNAQLEELLQRQYADLRLPAAVNLRLDSVNKVKRRLESMSGR